MKLTTTSYRISKNGSIITTIEKDAFTSKIHLGESTKQSGIYYFFSRKQGNLYIYLP